MRLLRASRLASGFAAGATAQGAFTTPARRGVRAGLRFGVSGDSRGDLAPFPAIVGAEKAFYDALPLPGKEAFVTSLVDAQLLPLGYDLLGRDGSSIPATLVADGWTETPFVVSQSALDAR